MARVVLLLLLRGQAAGSRALVSAWLKGLCVCVMREGVCCCRWRPWREEARTHNLRRGGRERARCCNSERRSTRAAFGMQDFPTCSASNPLPPIPSYLAVDVSSSGAAAVHIASAIESGESDEGEDDQIQTKHTMVDPSPCSALAPMGDPSSRALNS